MMFRHFGNDSSTKVRVAGNAGRNQASSWTSSNQAKGGALDGDDWRNQQSKPGGLLTPVNGIGRAASRPRGHRQGRRVHPSGPPKAAPPLSPKFPIPLECCIALDCEMVGVGPQKQSVLARVSITDYLGETIFDVFVKINERVTDYRTHVSGIRPEDLESAKAMDFGQVRRRVIQLCQGHVLVGHAIENDLKVLRLHHPWYLVRDTSRYAAFMRLNECGVFQPRRLRDLSRQFLGATIQEDEHDSLEDARAAMNLYKIVKEEWDYWVALSAGHVPSQHQPAAPVVPESGYDFAYQGAQHNHAGRVTPPFGGKQRGNNWH